MCVCVCVCVCVCGGGDIKKRGDIILFCAEMCDDDPLPIVLFVLLLLSQPRLGHCLLTCERRGRREGGRERERELEEQTEKESGSGIFHHTISMM